MLILKRPVGMLIHKRPVGMLVQVNRKNALEQNDANVKNPIQLRAGRTAMLGHCTRKHVGPLLDEQDKANQATDERNQSETGG